jgi:adenosylmethionine-8-amino-7-oxononanoate aminotransferase
MSDFWQNGLEFDRKQLWHPYTSMRDPLPVYPVHAARGTRIELADGRTLIDGMASWWAAIHGYNHPVLNAALQTQLERTAHVMFGGLTHEPAVRLGQQLVSVVPHGLCRVFFCDSGSVSVEVAIKMAVQYWQAQNRPQKQRLLTVRGGYHGDTLGAMSVCDPVSGMHSLFSGMLPQQLFAPLPEPAFDADWDDRALREFELLLTQHAAALAAVVIEPIVQGAGGMRFYHAEYLRRLRALCDAHDVLLICDEIATGFGRSGKLFACEYAGITPDILCLGKALTGGYLTLAATLTTARVADVISDGPHGGTFMHGPTFMANPLACAVASASIDLLLQGNWLADVTRIESELRAGLAACRSATTVNAVRVLGAIGVVEMRQPVDMAAAQRHFVARGVWIRPFGKLVYLMPPYVATSDDIAQLCAAIVSWVSA